MRWAWQTPFRRPVSECSEPFRNVPRVLAARNVTDVRYAITVFVSASRTWITRSVDQDADARDVHATSVSIATSLPKRVGMPVPGDACDGALINHPDTDLADATFDTSGVAWQTIYYQANYPRLQRVKALTPAGCAVLWPPPQTCCEPRASRRCAADETTRCAVSRGESRRPTCSCALRPSA